MARRWCSCSVRSPSSWSRRRSFHPSGSCRARESNRLTDCAARFTVTSSVSCCAQACAMFPGAVLLLLLGPALLVVLQAGSAVGRRGITLGAAIVLLPGAIWCALEWIRWHDDALPDDPTTLAPVTSETCYKCHESHYASWKHTFHRTMTREATPEFVKADFDNAEHTYMGVTSRLIRQGNRYFMDLVDPAWASEMVRRGVPLGEAGTPPRRKVSV